HDSIHNAFALKLRPHPVGVGSGKDHVELNLRAPIGKKRVSMHPVDQVIAEGQEMTPASEVLLKPVGWLDSKEHQCFHASNGDARLHRELHCDVRTLLLG